MSLRKIYYSLPAAWRLYARQIIYWPEDAIQRLLTQKQNLIPPKSLIYTGRGDFIQTGLRLCSLAIQFAELSPKTKILDIGCGIGRLAIPLTNILDEEGFYKGFDLMKPGIEWCQKNISSRFKNFNFVWVDLRNDLYREKGFSSLSYTFDAPESSMDLAFSISVFTHMLDNEIEHYLSESARVLKPGGFLIASFFAVEDDHKHLQLKGNMFEFPVDKGHYFLMDSTLPEGNVAFLQSYVENYFQVVGLKIAHFFPGQWKGGDNPNSKDFQDIYILEKTNS